MNIFHKNAKEKMCAWDGYYFPAVGRQEYCSGECKNAARRERARVERDVKAAEALWESGEYNNRELAEAITRAQFMPDSMRMEVQREADAQTVPRFRRWIRFKYEIIRAMISIWIDQKKGKFDGSISTPSSSGK